MSFQENLYSFSRYLGVGGLIVFSLLVVFCLLKRRKDIFDGNFDPANVGSVKGGGGGTLPEIDLEENGLLLVNNEVEVDEDGGMGRRLGSGPEGGGIIMPYSFQPAPVGGTATGQQYQNHQQMQQISNIGIAADGVGAVLAAGHPNRKRAMRQQNVQHTSNQSRSFYPSSSGPNPHLNSNTVSPEPYSPGPFVLSPSNGGRNANETEAMGDSDPQLPAFQQANLQTGPGPHQQQQYLLSSSPKAVPSQLSTPSRAGIAFVPVVHEDGGRVVFEEQEGEGEVLNPELPPTYDSLPVDVRRDG